MWIIDFRWLWCDNIGSSSVKEKKTVLMNYVDNEGGYVCVRVESICPGVLLIWGEKTQIQEAQQIPGDNFLKCYIKMHHNEIKGKQFSKLIKGQKRWLVSKEPQLLWSWLLSSSNGSEKTVVFISKKWGKAINQDFNRENEGESCHQQASTRENSKGRISDIKKAVSDVSHI